MKEVKVLGQDIGLTYQYFKSIGKYNYSRSAVSRGQWQAKKVEGVVYVLYDSLPQTTKNELPSRDVLLELATTKKKQTKIQTQSVSEFIENLTEDECLKVTKYKVVNSICNSETGEEFVLNVTELPESEIKRVLTLAVYVKTLANEKFKVKSYRENFGFKKFSDFQYSVTSLYEANTKKNFSLKTWLMLVEKYKQNGIESLISKNFGNEKARKVSWDGLQFLIAAMSQENKPSYSLITKAYNANFEPITEMQVYNILNTPSVIPAWYMSRFGYEAFKNKFGYTLLRFKPRYADSLWCSDGTKVNYYYLDNGRLSANLTMYAVVDVTTEYILGWSICRGAENSEEIRKAVKMAFTNSGGVMPYQFQYDNAAPNIKFFADLGSLHFPTMPHNGQSKMIENIFGRFQRQIMRRRYNYTGQNIQAVKLESKINPDLVKEFLENKTEKLPKNYAEVLEHVAEDVAFWNATKVNGKSRAEHYRNSKRPERRKLQKDDMRDMFWVWSKKPITYKNVGLEKQENYKKYFYEVFLENGSPDLEFHNRSVGKEFWVKYNPDDLSEVALYEQDSKKQFRFVAYAKERLRLPMAVEDYNQESKTLIQRGLETKKIQKQMAINQANAARNEHPDVESSLNKAFIDDMDTEELAKIAHLMGKEAQYRAESLPEDSEQMPDIDLFDDKFTKTW